jgi:hypothetical protein
VFQKKLEQIATDFPKIWTFVRVNFIASPRTIGQSLSGGKYGFKANMFVNGLDGVGYGERADAGRRFYPQSSRSDRHASAQ